MTRLWWLSVAALIVTALCAALVQFGIAASIARIGFWLGLLAASVCLVASVIAGSLERSRQGRDRS